MSGLRLLATTKRSETEPFSCHHLSKGPQQAFEDELPPRDEADEEKEMHVEEEVVGRVMEPVRVAPRLFALRGRLRRFLSLGVHRETNRLYDLLLTTGVSPGDA